MTCIRNIYVCSFKSDNDYRELTVVSHSFGDAACLALEHTVLWEDAEAFELVNVHLSGICIIDQ